MQSKWKLCTSHLLVLTWSLLTDATEIKCVSRDIAKGKQSTKFSQHCDMNVAVFSKYVVWRWIIRAEVNRDKMKPRGKAIKASDNKEKMKKKDDTLKASILYRYLPTPLYETAECVGGSPSSFSVPLTRPSIHHFTLKRVQVQSWQKKSQQNRSTSCATLCMKLKKTSKFRSR